jgi:hypothetical protein
MTSLKIGSSEPAMSAPENQIAVRIGTLDAPTVTKEELKMLNVIAHNIVDLLGSKGLVPTDPDSKSKMVRSMTRNLVDDVDLYRTGKPMSEELKIGTIRHVIASVNEVLNTQPSTVAGYLKTSINNPTPGIRDTRADPLASDTPIR